MLALVGFVAWDFLCCCGLYAAFQSIGSYEYSKREMRSDSAICVLYFIIPVGCIIAPFVTGFFEHGFQIPFTYRRAKCK